MEGGNLVVVGAVRAEVVVHREFFRVERRPEGEVQYASLSVPALAQTFPFFDGPLQRCFPCLPNSGPMSPSGILCSISRSSTTTTFFKRQDTGWPWCIMSTGVSGSFSGTRQRAQRVSPSLPTS